MNRTIAEGVRRHALQVSDKTGAAALFLLLPAVGYYALLLTAGGSSGLVAPVMHGLTFNSMLLHLLHGRFDVDPAVIGYEGYLRDGAVYAYFGLLPALLRAPFLLLPDFATTDFTRFSCLLADSLMALLKVLSALVVWRSAGKQWRSAPLSLLLVTILMSGPQIQFLRPSIYQEVILWADVFAAAFVLLVLHGWTRSEGFSIGLMSALAAIAGLCLLTRVSTALGLYLAVTLVSLWHASHELRSQRPESLRLLALAWPVLVLAGFAAATAIVNQERWGNPLVFVDLSLSVRPILHVDQHVGYGNFSLVRLGYGLGYYFLPIWVLRDGSGQLLWSSFVQGAMSAVELPPSSFLLSDPLIIGLAIYGSARLARGTAVPRRLPIALTALALVIPIVLMLTAMSMTFRYRMEFYPLFEFCAFVGFWCLLQARPRRIAMVFGGAALVSILVAQFLWLLYMLSPLGMASESLGENSVVGFYECLLKRCPESPAESVGAR
jgi:hypothetical protein